MPIASMKLRFPCCSATLNCVPKIRSGIFFLGYLHLMINQPEQSIAALTKGLVLDPENVYGLCKLARAHRARGTGDDLDQAAAILAKLQVIAPEHLRVRWLQKELSREA